MPRTQEIRPLLVNSGITNGGSAKAARRLLRGLRALGVDAQLVSSERADGEPGIVGATSLVDRSNVFLSKCLEVLLQKINPQRQPVAFTSAWAGIKLRHHIHASRANVVHLNQITNGFLSLRAASRLGCPTVWTLHDWWAVTGGCHFPGECSGYLKRCGHCPVLGSRRQVDLSRVNYGMKCRAWRASAAHLVAVSEALRNNIGQSPMMMGRPMAVIPNGLDLDIFRPIPRSVAREALGLPQDMKILLFGAKMNDLNKGYSSVQALLSAIAQGLSRERYLLVRFGDRSAEAQTDLPIRTKSLGIVSDDILLSLIYSAGDMTLVPSLQESFGLVAAESLACGTPVLAYRTGGLTDIVDHKSNGYLAKPYSLEDYIAGFDWISNQGVNQQAEYNLRANARIKAERKFDIKDVARQYLQQYAIAIDRSMLLSSDYTRQD